MSTDKNGSRYSGSQVTQYALTRSILVSLHVNTPTDYRQIANLFFLRMVSTHAYAELCLRGIAPTGLAAPGSPARRLEALQ